MSTEIVRSGGEVVQTGALMPLVTIDQMVSRHKSIQECANRIMKEGQDFGVIPGTERKDGTKNLVLLKPGAEKLCTLFGLTPDFQEDKVIVDFDKGLFFFSYRCVLLRGAAQEMNAAGKVVTIGQIVGTGIGSCNSREKKYRRGAKVCPTCGAANIRRSKKPPRDDPGAEPGWYCWANTGGCGANFAADDSAITEQSATIDPNEAAELVNTLQKMAQKRSMVSAVLVATNASDLFTQDFVEDESPRQEQQPTKPRQNNKPAPPKKDHAESAPVLQRWIEVKAANLTSDGYPCSYEALLTRVCSTVAGAGHQGTMEDWNDAALRAGTEALKAAINEIKAGGKVQSALSPEDFIALNAALKQAGRTWQQISDALKLPAGVSATAMSREQFEAVMAALEEDAPVPV